MPLPTLTTRRCFWLGIAALAGWLILATRFSHYDDKNPSTLQSIHSRFTTILATLLAPATWLPYHAQSTIDHTLHSDAPPVTGTAQDLAEKNFELVNQVMLLANRVNELQRTVSDLSGVKGAYHLSEEKLLPATLSGQSTSPSGQIYFLDKGSAQGVRPGMIVLSRLAPLGRIINVGTYASELRLITDPATKMIARVVRPVDGGTLVISDSALITGAGDNALRCDSIKVTGLEPRPGDMLVLQDPDWSAVTGAPLGEIDTVKRSESAILRYDITITPRVTVSRSNNVMILIPGR
jgi:cell shape-determining protein MreC